MTYLQACQKLFELAGIKFSFGELGVRTRHQYRYPKEVVCEDKSAVYDYFKRRSISKETLDYADVRQDEKGNTVWNYYDTNDVLTMVKYRPSRKVRKGENKQWCQPDADTCNLLFNMNRVNVDAPLLICEGEPDCLSAIEAGYLNSLTISSSVPTTMRPESRCRRKSCIVWEAGGQRLWTCRFITSLPMERKSP